MNKLQRLIVIWRIVFYALTTICIIEAGCIAIAWILTFDNIEVPPI